MSGMSLRKAAPVGVIAMGSFLAFTAQWLFCFIEPGPLERGEAYKFNALVAISFLCFVRTSITDPGRIPPDWHQALPSKEGETRASLRQRWCRRCEAHKPPRAHHCKSCKRCVVRMDHHCIWTANCISLVTYPHFMRYLVYGIAAMGYLEFFLWQRCAVLWEQRHLPQYLGPSALQLAHLFALVVANSLILFGVILLFIRTFWSLLFNTTTIEGWEVERHETLLRRARVLGGFLYGPDGSRVRIERQEFPWDVGILRNICEGMGSWNPLSWLWPFARSPNVTQGLSFPHNEIEDPSRPWPPPDPDRLFRAPRRDMSGDGFTQTLGVDAFRQRQAADRVRYADTQGEYVVRRRPFHERLEAMEKNPDVYNDAVGEDDRSMGMEGTPESTSDSEGRELGGNDGDAGEEAWRTSEGERLADFGVDEEVDFYDEDNVPLGELIRRRKGGDTG